MTPGDPAQERRARAWAQFKRRMAAGFLLVIPAALTAWILLKLLRIADGLIRVMPKAWQPQTYTGFEIPGLGLLLVLLTVFLAGHVTTTFLGNSVVKTWEGLLSRIPLVRGIYTSIQQLFRAVFSSNQKFSRAVLVEWPRKGTWAIGFVTGVPPRRFIDRFGEEMVSVFLPSTPNPTTGFYFMISTKEVVALDMGVDDAFKVIMSAGLVFPDQLGPVRPLQPDSIDDSLPPA